MPFPTYAFSHGFHICSLKTGKIFGCLSVAPKNRASSVAYYYPGNLPIYGKTM